MQFAQACDRALIDRIERIKEASGLALVERDPLGDGFMRTLQLPRGEKSRSVSRRAPFAAVLASWRASSVRRSLGRGVRIASICDIVRLLKGYPASCSVEPHPSPYTFIGPAPAHQIPNRPNPNRGRRIPFQSLPRYGLICDRRREAVEVACGAESA